MKNIITLITLTLFYTSCKAQTPILPYFNNPGYGEIENAYYKDIDNFMDSFVGTWIATKLNITFKVTFVKKTMFYMEDIPYNYYTDELIGEFQYYENGNLITSTLFNLNNNYANPYNYSFSTIGRILKDHYSKCFECTANEWRLLMRFTEPANDDPCLNGAFAMRIVMENGVEKLKAQFYMKDTACGYKDDGTPSTARYFSVPFGNYTFVKE